MALAIDKIFSLTTLQRKAVIRPDSNVVVTAGAGSGKTRTLVARYLHLLSKGHQPPQVVAITFTEKAAREMRNRVRSALRDLQKSAETLENAGYWGDMEVQIDAARIGTIHSLCAEILRAHPAEAGVDPLFEVLAENHIPALKARAIESALAWAVDQPHIKPIFESLPILKIIQLLADLMEKRLEATSLFSTLDPASDTTQTSLIDWMHTNMKAESFVDAVSDLADLRSQTNFAEVAGDTMAAQIDKLLTLLEQAETAIGAGDDVQAALALFSARRNHSRLNLGKRRSLAKTYLQNWRQAYDHHINPWLGGAQASDLPPDPTVESLHRTFLPLVGTLFQVAQQHYRQALDESQALDFDDLEFKAQTLLQDSAIRSQWQDEITAVLVDEFQDTNRRQQDIVHALCGEVQGRRFLVGDARQSIYRFRGAEVEGFLRAQAEEDEQGGLVIDLDRTFRTHPGLAQNLDDLLAPILGAEFDPQRSYFIPYTRLKTARKASRHGIRSPHCNLILGVGPSADEGRAATADALAGHLITLRQEGQVKDWAEVALLFRASPGFPPYEDALENYGIPYVTVAGRGFYDRPEIRDMLNILRAVADPWDDLALVGLLRSPGFGLSDPAIYRLRQSSPHTRPLWTTLNGELDMLNDQDQKLAERARRIVSEMTAQVDRLPIAILLKRIIDRTDYRAVLATSRSRMWRNLDKLLADAFASKLVRVRAYLEYVQTLRDIGAREGEATVDPSGSVQIMTVHKAKGLEFPIVVLADAARRVPHHSAPAHLSQEFGVALKMDRIHTQPMAYRLARYIDREQSRAEENRLLYVALTRASEKVIISGHLTAGRGRWKASGWLGQLLESVGVDVDALRDGNTGWQLFELRSKGEIGILLQDSEVQAEAMALTAQEPPPWPESSAAPLYRSLIETSPDRSPLSDQLQGRQEWTRRATGESLHPPAIAVGKMVHRALQRWISPEDTRLAKLLAVVAYEEGMVEPNQRSSAIRAARRLLNRLHTDPVWSEIDEALERHHEVHFTFPSADGDAKSGVIDLLYRTKSGWRIIDFKTDEINSADVLKATVDQYSLQVGWYAQSARFFLNEPVVARICFLDYKGSVIVKSLKPDRS